MLTYWPALKAHRLVGRQNELHTHDVRRQTFEAQHARGYFTYRKRQRRVELVNFDDAVRVRFRLAKMRKPRGLVGVAQIVWMHHAGIHVTFDNFSAAVRHTPERQLMGRRLRASSPARRIDVFTSQVKRAPLGCKVMLKFIVCETSALGWMLIRQPIFRSFGVTKFRCRVSLIDRCSAMYKAMPAQANKNA
jgi:hypothetical protein